MVRWEFVFGKENSLRVKSLGRILLGHRGPRRRDILDKNSMQVAFFCCLRQGVAGKSRDLGRDVPDLEKFYARKRWADLSFPNSGSGKCFQELISETVLFLLRDRPCLKLFTVFNNFQALLFLQDDLLESV